MRLRLPLVTAIALAGCAAEPMRASPATEAAPVESTSVAPREATLVWRLLRDAELFESEATGDGGRLPEPVIAYRQLLRAPDAVAAFRRLLVEAKPGGRLYALCGLLELEPAGAAEAARRAGLLEARDEVEALDGCEGSLEGLGALARRFLDARDVEMTGWRRRIRGTGRGWREGSPDGGFAERGATTLAAFDHLAALDALLGNGPPPPWASTAEAQATEVDEERRRRRDERELGHVEEHLAQDGVDELRYRLASRLVQFGPASIPALVDALRRPEPSVRMAALIALDRLGAWGEEGVPALAAAVDDPDVRVRRMALLALGHRPDRPEALAALRRALTRPDEESELLQLALGGLLHRELGPELAAPLVRLVAHRHPTIREEAMDVLSSLGPGGAPALPWLLAEARLAEGSTTALGAIVVLGSGVAGPALADLLVELDEERGPRQEEVARHLTYLEPPERAVATARVLERTAPEVGRALAGASDGAARVAALVSALDAPARSARLAALITLGDEPLGVSALEPLAADLTEPARSDLAGEGLARLGRVGLEALGRVTLPGLRKVGQHAYTEQRLVGLLRDLLRSDDPPDRAAALEWIEGGPYRDDVEHVLVDALGVWLERWRTHPHDPAEWHAAVGILLRWSTGPARHLLDRIADEAPQADVRQRAAEALGR